MESDELKKALERYWDGESSLEDEAALKKLLNSPEMRKKYPKEAALFSYYAAQKKNTLSDRKSKELMGNLPKTKGKTPGVIGVLWNTLKVAAAILVVATAGWLVRNEMRGSADAFDGDSFENPEEAYAETRRALEMLSRNLSKGREQASKFKAYSEAEQKAKNLMEVKQEDKL